MRIAFRPFLPALLAMLAAVTGPAPAAPEHAIATPDGERDGMPVVRLSPRVRTEPLPAEIRTIPVSAIAPFLTRAFVADSQSIEQAPYVVGFPDERLAAGGEDVIHVRRIARAEPREFEVLRPGDALRDPETNEILGFQAQFVGYASLERTGDPAVLRMHDADREVAVGDRLIPAVQDDAWRNFIPTPAPAGTRGQILSVLNGVSQIGIYDVVIINRGRHDRLDAGHQFDVFVGGTQGRDQMRDGLSRDWRGESPLSTEFWYGGDYRRQGSRYDEPDPNTPLPPHADFRRDRATYIRPFDRAGRLMVFRTFERVSLALVLVATQAMQVGNRIVPASD